MELALYGNTKIPRIYCNDCERWALVVDDVRQCCDRRIGDDEEINKYHRIIEPEGFRSRPSMAEQRAILNRQRDRCLYCDRRFGSLVWYKGKRVTLRRHWDHLVPFDYARDNNDTNFVAACHVCNHWKSSKIFGCLEEIQVYVTEKWERCGTDVGKALRGMREALPE